MKIPIDMIKRVINNFNTRVRAVILQQAARIEHIINYQRTGKLVASMYFQIWRTKFPIMLELFGEKIFMICCLSKKLDEKQNRALFLDHPVF